MSKDAVAPATDDPRRWRALLALCLGGLTVVLDTTIVNVALPSIREDLQFTATSLVWVVNAYLLTFGGSLLLGARLGDVYGHRKLFLMGMTLFTLASVACGLANTSAMLVIARAVQGVGGAVVIALVLSLIVKMFTGTAERAKAIAIYGFVCYAGGSVGLLMGGALTTALNWHWIFLVNLPIGVVVYVLCLAWVPDIRPNRPDGRLDFWGAITITGSLVLALYVVANENGGGSSSSHSFELLACSATLFAAFLVIETRVPKPLVPLSIFTVRNLTVSVIASGLWVAGARTWTFIAPLYMQLVLGYTPMQIALVFLPANVIMAAFSLGLSAKLVTRFGARKPLALGMVLGAIGLALLARAPVDGGIGDLLPSMIIIGVGTGIVLNPLVFAAMSDVAPHETGLASGILNTVSLMGGAVGLTIVASVSAGRASQLLASGAIESSALTGGYRAAFLLGALCAGMGALLTVMFLRRSASSTAPLPARV